MSDTAAAAAPPASELLAVLWDDGNGTVNAQRFLVSPTGDDYLLLDGRPTDLTKVIGPVSYDEAVGMAQRLLRDGIVSESDMARALCVCMAFVACTRPHQDKPRLLAVPPPLRERVRSKTEAAQIAAELRERDKAGA